MKKNASSLSAKYSARYTNYLLKMAADLEHDVRANIDTCERIDQIRARAKSVKRFCAKANKKEGGKRKYKDPINQIQDQLGVRIVTYYLNDVIKISKMVEKYYSPIEKKSIVPDAENKFGYEGKHYILFVPSAILPELHSGDFPKFFELQITTLFQHSWAEAEHDLGYKPNRSIEIEEKRKMAFAAAQAWGADNIFEELFLKSKAQRRK